MDVAVLTTSSTLPWGEETCRGIPKHLQLSPDQDHDEKTIQAFVVDHQPDIVVLGGWSHPPYVRLAQLPALREVRFILAMDTPWRWELRQYLAKYKLRGYLKRMAGVAVTGERCWQYAHRLGFAEDRILRGVYGVDYDLLSSAMTARCANAKPWPHRFLFVGRYADTKAVDVLAKAYKQYRRDNPDPWKLICCGRGPMESVFTGVEGLENRGFLNPVDLPKTMAEAGCYVMPSRYDPWPLAIVESCAAGLPIICSGACGSHIELVRSFYNGRVIGTENVAALADAMRWMQGHADQLPEMGRRSQTLAAAYSAQMWAERWSDFIKRLLAQ
ncbi:MAG: glycosyltransferase family 4 protein [Phycisphaerales bacterium]